jgi:nicotinamide/nicotinate riboside kinase
MQEPPAEVKDPLLIGLSGPSSSGKTTVARILKRIFSNAIVVHEDDFYYEDPKIPYRDVPKRIAETGEIVRSLSGHIEVEKVQDWDCIEALNLSALHDALLQIKETSTLPQLKSIQDQQAVGPGGELDEGVTAELRKRVFDSAPALLERSIILVDGFMLFTESQKNIARLFDIKLLLRTTFVEAKRRREARKGYVTLEGFWEDPPFYVDDIVWPNFQKEHAFLFKGGDVEGEFDERVCEEMGIRGMPIECSSDIKTLTLWAVDEIIASMRAKDS